VQSFLALHGPARYGRRLWTSVQPAPVPAEHRGHGARPVAADPAQSAEATAGRAVPAAVARASPGRSAPHAAGGRGMESLLRESPAKYLHPEYASVAVRSAGFSPSWAATG